MRQSARVLERRVDLDVEALGLRGVEVGIGTEAPGMDAVDGAGALDLVDVAGGRRGREVGIGPEAAGMDAVDGAEIVDLVDVAGDAERPHDLARRVADELAA